MQIRQRVLTLAAQLAATLAETAAATEQQRQSSSSSIGSSKLFSRSVAEFFCSLILLCKWKPQRLKVKLWLMATNIFGAAVGLNNIKLLGATVLGIVCCSQPAICQTNPNEDHSGNCVGAHNICSMV